MERSTENQVVERGDQGMTDQQEKRIIGQLSKQKKPPLDALEHRARKEERQVGEALKMRVKLT
jgi:hypothetical protein